MRRGGESDAPAILFSRPPFQSSGTKRRVTPNQSDMHRPDRIHALVIALIAFSLYVALANVLTSLAWVFLPLGTVGSVWAGSTAIVTLGLFDSVIAYLYIIRQRKRAQ